MKNISLLEATLVLKKGGVGIVPTDTLYGIVASALLPEAVERTYRTRDRNEQKPCIVLVAGHADLAAFGIFVSTKVEEMLRILWSGAVSVIFSDIPERFAYLHRGTGTLAFRVPSVPGLREFLHATGPLIAPSANRQGKKPAETIEEAFAYFGESLDFFVDGGKLSGEPSTVVRLEGERLILIRQGRTVISSELHNETSLV